MRSRYPSTYRRERRGGFYNRRGGFGGHPLDRLDMYRQNNRFQERGSFRKTGSYGKSLIPRIIKDATRLIFYFPRPKSVFKKKMSQRPKTSPVSMAQHGKKQSKSRKIKS